MQRRANISRQEYIEEAAQLETYNILPPLRERDHTDFAPLYESSSFHNLLNWYPSLEEYSGEDKAVITLYEFEKGPEINDGWGTGDTRWDRHRNYRIKRIYHWVVKSWTGVNEEVTIQRRYNHFLWSQIQ